jgi:hypothetical protein
MNIKPQNVESASAQDAGLRIDKLVRPDVSAKE